MLEIWIMFWLKLCLFLDTVKWLDQLQTFLFCLLILTQHFFNFLATALLKVPVIVLWVLCYPVFKRRKLQTLRVWNKCSRISLVMVRLKTCSRTISPSVFVTFVKTHPNLVFLWHKGRNFRAITGHCKLATPINFIRGMPAGKLDSFWFDFVSVSDKRGSVINDYL